ncbi:hypothetical protein [Streptacidiphilus sp. MAP12-20]|uniref:hypothetical protein n=1 Tax=Streptacidiphilus sp. MAP12-20 TaxID=3156299 RepID=UPI003513CBAD
MADVAPQAVAWDPLEVSIVVRSGTPARIALDEVSAVLQDLGATRTWEGYRCFCGDPLTLPAALAGLANH